MNKESYIPLYLEYINNGGAVSPMNTETCRKYIQSKIDSDVTQEDILWLFYHSEPEVLK